MIDRRTLVGAGVVTGLAARAAAQMPPPVRGGALPAGLPQPTETIDLWPNGAPGMPAAPLVETVNERSTDPQLTDRVVFGISRPRMVVFRPDVPNGAAVLITPGGGYRWVVIDKEGYELGRWLSARGFTVFVLFYRLPGEGWAAGPDVALSDAQRAMRLIELHGLPVSEAAAEAGYADQAHMTRAFRQFAGFTPGSRIKVTLVSMAG
jgi:acetyl esterase/lipase